MYPVLLIDPVIKESDTSVNDQEGSRTSSMASSCVLGLGSWQAFSWLLFRSLCRLRSDFLKITRGSVEQEKREEGTFRYYVNVRYTCIPILNKYLMCNLELIIITCA